MFHLSYIWDLESIYEKRKMLLLVTSKYKDLTRDDLEEFCKRYSFTIFPLALLDSSVKDSPNTPVKEVLLKMGSTIEYLKKTKESFDFLSSYEKNIRFVR